ncbi:MAG TPA: 4-hydroxy-tetrahydrodipicolinate reductase [Verrucomicrobiae bacterium]|nr:4-hydroxy-tetrahydrodipicolinate reductase [Verrucomicrobiae bacterium]
MERIKVFVSGAAGKMGREVVRAVLADKELQLVGAADSNLQGVDVGQLAGIDSVGVTVSALSGEILKSSGAQVMVDFTAPHSVMPNCKLALENGVRPVIGTTGLTEEDLSEIVELAKQANLGVFIAPNFSIGAILMMKFAQEAAQYFPNVEIIELHHDQKLDAPSGTGLKTAEMIASVRPEFTQGHANEYEKLPGARGGNFKGLRIHSIRLPGLVAHQEVIFGGLGQTLSVRHDAYNRETYMPGVVLAVKKVINLKGLVIGLENII